MPFPPNKTFKELGLDPNATFRVVDNRGNFKAGDLITLFEDDGALNPRFNRIADGLLSYVTLSYLEYATPPVKTFETLEIGDEVKWNRNNDQKMQVLDFSLNKKLVALSQPYIYGSKRSERLNGWYTKNEFENVFGLKIIQPEPPKEEVQEMTVGQIEQALGKKIKIVE